MPDLPRPAGIDFEQLFRFAAVGVVATLTDAAVLETLTRLGLLGEISARIPSYLTAATVGWLLNRRFTFTSLTCSHPLVQWALYVAANGISFGVNILTYTVLITTVDLFRAHLWLAVVIASGVAMFFAFFANKWVVFRDRGR